jgi:hypothetical protein
LRNPSSCAWTIGPCAVAVQAFDHRHARNAVRELRHPRPETVANLDQRVMAARHRHEQARHEAFRIELELAQNRRHVQRMVERLLAALRGGVLQAQIRPVEGTRQRVDLRRRVIARERRQPGGAARAVRRCNQRQMGGACHVFSRCLQDPHAGYFSW